MNILLIKPWGDSFNWYHSHMLGLAYLAAYVRMQGHAVTILDAAFTATDREHLLREVASRKPDIVGLTAMTHEIPRVREILGAVKRVDRAILTVLGGPHATARPGETVAEIPDLDFAVSGEGERPFSLLLSALESRNADLGSIEGLAYRDVHGVRYNGPQASFVDLTSLPPPAVDLYYTKDWFRSHPRSEYRMFASRGCPFRCVYCMRVLGGQVRWRDPESVVEEWVKAVRYYGARHVFLHDEIFLYDNPHTHAILDGVMRAGIHKEAHFSAMTHVKLVNRDILRKAALANCFKICIGVESGNNQMLRNSNRTYTIDEAHAAVREIKRAGIRPFTFFILGHPGETRATIWDSIRAAVRLNPYEIGMGAMVPYPGTKIYDLARDGQAGYHLTGADWDAYDRYGGAAVRFDNFSRRELVLYQVIGYILFFVLNGKFAGLYRYFRPKVRAALRVIAGRSL